jgi:hypothetical protein
MCKGNLHAKARLQREKWLAVDDKGFIERTRGFANIT